MNDKNTNKKTKNKLAEMTEQISGSLDATNYRNSGSYEYSTAYLAPKARQLIGLWKVIEHTVNGLPYAEVFCAASFKDIRIENIAYEATYEFTQNLCVKQVTISGDMDLVDQVVPFEFRMNMALSWELKSDMIQVLPVLGYQYTSVDGQPAAVRDLPRNTAARPLNVRFEYDYLILEDGDDIKTLIRVEA